MTMDVAPTYAERQNYDFDVTPSEVSLLVSDLVSERSPHLSIDRFMQYGGQTVYALTLTNPSVPREQKRGVFVARPHAHEPAGVAASTELAKMLTGYGAYVDAHTQWREHILNRFVVTLVPDSNPSGSRRAPVKFWTGEQVSREQFLLWMFGESGERPGERFPRVAAWDMREVTPPRLLGIAYEQISEHEYVEPNRDHRSTLFQSFFTLDKTHHYDLWIDLHQTEFDNSDRNCSAHLPVCHDELSPERQRKHESVARAVIAQWIREGAKPKAEPAALYPQNEIQRRFLAKVWKPIDSRTVHLLTEVQNDHPATPPVQQVNLQLKAILAAMEWLDGVVDGGHRSA